ncbi:unnamed protein product [marine sediment metagenome]|uniref:Uncharacterized protein n=1 Tax=marine sediment metagenome TaxID=412755 RepID=X1F893_9ZZZZ
MSEEAHPNIQAVAVTVDLTESIRRNLRGGAKGRENVVMEKLEPYIVEVMVRISTKIDEIVETEARRNE